MVEKVLIGAAGLGIASLAGSVIGLFVKRISHKWNDIFMGFCAGMMLAASIVGLVAPAVTMASLSGWWQVVAGVAAGVALIGMLDYFTPHLHHLTGLDIEKHKGNTTVNRIMMFVIAIAIHKLPEGMATGIVFDENNLSNAYAVTISIALQNIPDWRGFRQGACHIGRCRVVGNAWSRGRFRPGRFVWDVPSGVAGYGRWCHALCDKR